MSARSVVPAILRVLEPYLEQLDSAWADQPQRDRRPTLPLTTSGKINVRQLVRNLGLPQNQEQHFYEKPELAGPINAIARVQGVKLIGSTALSDIADAGLRRRIGRAAETISELRRTLAERESTNVVLRKENSLLRARLELIEESGLYFRAPK